MKKALREIPPVHELLDHCRNGSWAVEFSRDQLLRAVREELADLRKRLQDGPSLPVVVDDLIEAVRQRAFQGEKPSLRKVINATGVIVHTNLGRAPLAAEALSHASRISEGYSNLEFDLELGSRGSRDEHLETLFRRLLAAEASLVVNNNAAALFLVLNTLAQGKEVLVSRGELVEIGGSFRLPEIMKKSGAVLKEVGTTNKTRVADYRNAFTPDTGLILVVHPSNFQIIGFTERPELSELVDLGKELQIPVVEDQGSGIFWNLQGAGIEDEPDVVSRLSTGVDLISFSGDKVLGGPQAGILCGKKTLIGQCKHNPLFRALRVDKLIYSALEATLMLYAAGRAERIPVIRMISLTLEELKVRGALWLAELQGKMPRAKWSLLETLNYIGGGVAPMKSLSSCAVCLEPENISVQDLAMFLRKTDPPVVARIEENRLLFEIRTVLLAEQPLITELLQSLIK